MVSLDGDGLCQSLISLNKKHFWGLIVIPFHKHMLSLVKNEQKNKDVIEYTKNYNK